IGSGALCLAWAGVVFALRAWQVPETAEPMDRVAFQRSIPQGEANKAAAKIEEALAEFLKNAKEGDLPPEGPWLIPLADSVKLPPGVIVTPTSDGQTPLLRHLPGLRKMTTRLRLLSKEKREAGQPKTAFEHLAQILALSRNLRNKAPLES